VLSRTRRSLDRKPCGATFRFFAQRSIEGVMKKFLRAAACYVLSCALALCLMSVGGCKPAETEGVAFLAWSPQGDLIASIFEGAIYVGHVEGVKSLKGFNDPGVAENYLSWSPDGKCVAFASDKRGSWDIWVLNLESGKAVQAVRHPAKERLPFWLPPGRYILHLSYRGLQPDLWLYDIETGGVEEITHDALVEEQVSSSADGSRIAFISRDEDGAADLNVVEPMRDRRTTLLHRSRTLLSAQISPSGEKVCYTDEDGLHVADVRFGSAGADRLLVKRKDRAIDRALWSPDGGSILFSRGGVGWLRRLGFFGGCKLLARTPGGDRLHCWSPDGRMVAYAAGEPGERPLVALVDVRKYARTWLMQGLEDAVAAAEYLERAGCWEEIVDVLERGLADYPYGDGMSEAVAKLSEAYFRLEDYDALLKLHRDVTKDPMGLGLIYLFCYGDLDQARNEFEAVKKDNKREAKRYLHFVNAEKPDVLKIYCEAQLAKKQGRYSRAVDKLEAFVERASVSDFAEEAAYEAADICRTELKDYKAAAKAYRRALEKFPTSRHAEAARAALAEVLRSNLDRPEEALIEYEKLTDASSVDIKLDSLRAIVDIRRKRKEYKPAARYAELMLESLPPVNPKDPDADRKRGKRNKEQLSLLCEMVGLQLKADDVEAASAAGRRLTSMFAGKAEICESALPKLVLVFDRAGMHEAGDRFLEWAAGEGGIRISLMASPDDWMAMLKMAPRETVLKCRLGHLPDWLVRRMKVTASLIRRQSDKSLIHHAACLRMFAAERPADLEAVLAETERAGACPKESLPLVKAIAYYVLGNYYQSVDNLDAALANYERMHQAVGDDVTLGILKRYRKMLPGKTAMLQRWLDLERNTGNGIWEGIGGVLWTAMPGEQAQKGYADFIAAYPDSPLLGDAYCRAARYASGPVKERYLRKVVEDYPDCDSFGDAFEALMKYYYDRANYWLAGEFLRSLLKQENQKRRHAFYLIELCKIYTEKLRDVKTARKFLDVILQHYRGTVEWAFAKRLAATFLMDEGKWEEAIAEIQDLIKECPGDSWVQSGRALHTIAQCHEKMGDWKKAEEEYVNLITYYRDSPSVKYAKVLARIMPMLSRDIKRKLYGKFPMDFVRAAPQLSKEEREKLFVLFPDLPRRITEETDRQLKKGPGAE